MTSSSTLGAATETGNTPRWWRASRIELTGADLLIASAMMAATVAVLLLTMDLGYTRDEGYYFKAGGLYLGWFKELLANVEAGVWGESFTQAGVDKHWSYNWEHPGMIKALFGLSSWLFHETLGWMSVSTSFRFPAVVMAAVLSGLIYLFGAERFGRAEGVFAAIATLAMPRLFFHAHLACFDYPVTVMWFLVMYAYWKSLRSSGWGVVAGLCFGLALSTKLNAFFLPPTLFLHWLLVKRREFGVYRGGEGEWRLRLPAVPVAFLSMATLGPALFYLLWPRIWFDTFSRVSDYMVFHLKHVHYFQYYFGENLFAPPFPVEFPLMMSLVTMPEVVMLAGVCGTLCLLLRWLHEDSGGRSAGVRDRLGAWIGLRPSIKDDRGTGWWLLLGVLVPVAVIAKPDTPVFGGVKHWMPAMPFVALVASVAAVQGARSVSTLLTGGARRSKLRGALAGGVMLLMLSPGIQSTRHAHGYNMSYYNSLIGGARGAADKGMMRQFWGYTANHALDYFGEEVSPRGAIFFQNTNASSVAMYKRMKMMRQDIRHARTPLSGELGLIHNQMAAKNLELEIWAQYKTRNPSHVVSFEGVPVLTVYRNLPKKTRESAR